MTSSYHQQLQAKIDRITTQFSEFTPPTLEVFESPEQHFRMRAEFRIWHTEMICFMPCLNVMTMASKKPLYA